MSVGSKTIASILDIIFGDTYIATIYGSDRFFNLIFDLIILACYIYLFKHFCSFLTNMLTSLLNFDGQGFTRGTSDNSYGDKKATGIGFFESGNVADQFINATNYNTIEKETSGFIRRTAGFKTLDKYTGISSFSMLDKGKFSLRKTFTSGFGVVKKTTGSIYDQIIGNDLKKFAEIRKEKRENRPSIIEDLELIVKDKEVQNIIEQINNDKLSETERNAYKTRFNTMINENIKRNLKKYNLNNNKAEFGKNLDLAVERGLITENEKLNALNGGELLFNNIENDVINTDYNFSKGLHHNAKLSLAGLGRSTINFIEKNLLLNSIAGTNREQNLINISRLARMSKRGYFDMSIIGAGKMDIDKLIDGNISTEDYKKIMKHIRATGFNTNKYSTENRIKRNLNKNETVIRKTSYSADELRRLMNVSKDRSLLDREINNELGINGEYIAKEANSLKNQIINDLNEEGRESLKRALGINDDETMEVMAEKLKLVDTDEKYEDKIVIGYTDEGNVLYIQGVEEIGACDSDSELIKSLENDQIEIGAAVENITEDENQLSENDKQIIKHSEALMKVNNLKIKLAEYNASQEQNKDLKKEQEEKVEELKEKNKKIKRRKERIEKNNE